MRDELEEALNNGTIHIVNLLDERQDDSLPAVLDTEEKEYDGGLESLFKAVDQLDEVFQQTSRTNRGRLFLDVTRLLTTIDEEMFFAVLGPLLDMIQQYGGMCLGFLSPDAVPQSAREKLLAEADGIVRMWKEDNYKFIQVVKTVNSVLTPVNSIMETNDPPYVKILQY